MAEENPTLALDLSRLADMANDRVGDWFAEVGRVTILLGEATRFLFKGLRSFGLVVEQMYQIGVGSLWLVFAPFPKRVNRRWPARRRL